MIIVTGGAGFIGSAIVWKLNTEGQTDICIVDAMESSESWKNLVGLSFQEISHKTTFIEQVRSRSVPFTPTAIIHMGACSATTERNVDFLLENNYEYTKTLAKWALECDVPFIYASSAATYGDGNLGFSDDDDHLTTYRPINPYGYSKHLFDLWAKRNNVADRLTGLKFFNVFGPNEYHKGSMQSVVCRATPQIQEVGRVKLFKSYHPDYKDGEQKRDFIYIKDCVDVIWWLLQNPKATGLLNLGTGQAQTWISLVTEIFNALQKKVEIEFIEMPENVREHYQYFTEATVTKLRGLGYTQPFRSLAESVSDYVTQYIVPGRHLTV